ncbi:MAG: hypothetical protein ACTSV5_01340 [Promethearchaeota archaeon]
MMSKAKSYENYIGPRAIFDQNFIPPKILHREKEEHSLFSIMNDAITDDFGINILYQGIEGIGKKVIINKVFNDLLNQEHLSSYTYKIKVDCKEKKLEDLIISLLSEMNRAYNFKLDFQQILNSNLTDLWNLFKLACQKVNYNLLIAFNNVEHLNPEIFKKFLHLGKETNMILISTINKVLKPAAYDLLGCFDLKINLNYFSYDQLVEILHQRIDLAYTVNLETDLVEFITDLIFEYYVPVPGKGVDILRELYPLLNSEKQYKEFELYEIIQNQFDPLQISDEYSLLTYISEEDLLTIIFLDNLSDFFLKNSRYYINFQELKELYQISCESIDYDIFLEEFESLINTYQNIGILSTSRKTIFNNSRYFIIIPPKQLKAIVDTLFTKY